MHVCTYALYNRTRLLSSSIHMYLPIHQLLLPHPHIYTSTHTYTVSFQPSCKITTPRYHRTLYSTLTLPNLPCTMSILINVVVAIWHRFLFQYPYTSPPPGDLTLQYLQPYITFRANCIFFLPHHYPPLFLLIPSRLPCFRSLFLSGILGCRAGSGSGRPCMHASIAVSRGGAVSIASMDS